MHILQAGSFRMLYEDGFLRYLESGESEILRRIYFALRDENWATIALVISNEQIQSDDRSFEIAYDADNVEHGGKIFHWHVRITGTSDGEVNFVIDGTCLKKFRKNRAGFCVLHPLDGVRNAEVGITDTEGVLHASRFPDLIAANNPFKRIRKMSWSHQKDITRLNLRAMFLKQRTREIGEMDHLKHFVHHSNSPSLLT